MVGGQIIETNTATNHKEISFVLHYNFVTLNVYLLHNTKTGKNDRPEKL